MKKLLYSAILLVALIALGGIAVAQNAKEEMKETAAGTIVDIETTAGPIKVLLYDDTPLHRDNFVKLAEEGYYDGLLFHRVIKDFMVQAGDPESKDAKPGQRLGSGSPDYTIPAEIDYPRHYHKYGALAAARTGDQFNPERRSSGSQFYIVTGQKYPASQMQMMQARKVDSERQSYFRNLVMRDQAEIMRLQEANDTIGLETLRQKLIRETEANVKGGDIDPEIAKVYETLGGTPSLDGQYTVFGEVLSGMETVEKIQNASTDSSDRPTEDIRIIRMTVEKK